MHTTCWSSKIKSRVSLSASGQPIFRGSSQRENEERFTTSVSILSHRILLTESGRRVDFLSGTLTFPYLLVGLHCTNYFVSLWCSAASTDYAGIKSSTSWIVPNKYSQKTPISILNQLKVKSTSCL